MPDLLVEVGCEELPSSACREIIAQAPELFAATALVSASSIAIVLGLDALNERLSSWRG